jgi:hypothetical protein
MKGRLARNLLIFIGVDLVVLTIWSLGDYWPVAAACVGIPVVAWIIYSGLTTPEYGPGRRGRRWDGGGTASSGGGLPYTDVSAGRVRAEAKRVQNKLEDLGLNRKRQ